MNPKTIERMREKKHTPELADPRRPLRSQIKIHRQPSGVSWVDCMDCGRAAIEFADGSAGGTALSTECAR